MSDILTELSAQLKELQAYKDDAASQIVDA